MGLHLSRDPGTTKDLRDSSSPSLTFLPRCKKDFETIFSSNPIPASEHVLDFELYNRPNTLKEE